MENCVCDFINGITCQNFNEREKKRENRSIKIYKNNIIYIRKTKYIKRDEIL